MPTPQQVELFKRKARAQGFTEAMISQEIARKAQAEAKVAIAPVAKQTQSVIPPVTSPVAPAVPQKKGLLRSVAEGVVKPGVNALKLLSETAAQTTRAIGDKDISFANPLAKKQSFEVDKVRSQSDDLFKQERNLIQQAKNTKDKAEKARLLSEARKLRDAAEVVGNRAGKIGAKQKTFLEKEENLAGRAKIAETGGRRTAGAASYAIPGGAGVKGALAAGAATGGLTALSEDNSNLKDIAGGTIGGAAFGAAIPLAGKAFGAMGGKANRAINKILNPFKDQFDDEVVQLATQKGVDLPISAKTSSNFVKQVEALTQKSFWGGKTTQKIINARNQVDKLSEEITSELAKPVDKKGIGEIVKGGFDKFTDNFNTTKSELYDAVPEAISKAPASLDNTKEILAKIKERRGESLVSPNTKFFDDLSKKITPELTDEQIFLNGQNVTDDLGDAVAGAAGVTPEEARELTYQTLKQTRTDIGNKIKDFNDPVSTGEKASLKSLYAALSDDLEDTMKAADPAAYELFETANTFYREGIEKINSKVGQQIKNADPEKLLDTLIKPNSESQVAMVKSVLDPDTLQNLQEGFVSKMMNESLDRKKGFVDINKLKTQMTKYGEGTMKELLEPEQYEKLQQALLDLDDVSKLQKALQRGAKPAEGSQTAFLANTAGTLAGLFANPAVATAYVLGSGALVKGLESKLGQKLLGEGAGELSEIGGQKLSQPISKLLQKIIGMIGGAVGADVASGGTSEVEAAGVETPVDPALDTIGADPTMGEEDLLGAEQPEMPLEEETMPEEGAGIFKGATKQEVLEKAFRAGATSKQLDEIEAIYDRMQPQQNEDEISDSFLETGVPKSRQDRIWMLENPDKIPGQTKSKDSTEKERMFENAGFAATQALDILETKKVSTGPGQGTLGKIGEKTGTNSKDQQQYRSSIALARTAAKNALLGANMSSGEMESIEAFIPEFNDAPEIAKEKLRTFISMMDQFSGGGGKQ